MEVAFLLNVPPTKLEQDYYMIDLPHLIEKKRKQEVINRLNDIYTIIATNNRTLEDAEFQEFIRNLNNQLEIETEQKFDRAKFEQLRMMTKMGANKAR